jgi:hypothetical protein
MAVRIGEVFLWGFFVLLLYVMLRGRPHARHAPLATGGELADGIVATVVASETDSPEEKQPAVPPTTSTESIKREPTGRRANVAGVGTLFECVEYRCDGVLQTHVHRIDSGGKQLSSSCVYQEPFDSVARSFTTLAA